MTNKESGPKSFYLKLEFLCIEVLVGRFHFEKFFVLYGLACFLIPCNGLRELILVCK